MNKTDESDLILSALSSASKNQELIIISLEYLTHWLLQLSDKEADLTAFRIQTTLADINKSVFPLIQSAIKLRELEKANSDNL